MFSQARWRLVAWNVAVVFLLLLVIGAVVYGFFANNIYQGPDTLLQDRQNKLKQALFPGNSDIPPVSAGQIYYVQRQMDEPEDPTVITDTQGNYIFSSTCVMYYYRIVVSCLLDAQTPFDIEAVVAVA